MVKDLFGGESESQSSTPTGFQSLPGFAQTAFEDAIAAGTGFLNDPSIFGAVEPNEQMLQALSVLSEGAAPLTQERFGETFDIFNNPFIEQTLAPALRDLQEAGQSAFGDIASQASSAGAFGGTRQGVREAELGKNLAQEAGRLSANVRSAGFQDAATRAVQQLNSEQNNATALFDAGELLRKLTQQTQQAPATATEFLAQLAAGLPAGGGSTTTNTGGSGGIAGSLGSVASGASGIIDLFS